MVSERQRDELRQKKLAVSNVADQNIVGTGWILIVVFTLMWAVLLHVSLRKAPLNDNLFGYKTYYWGGVMYLTGVVLAQVKEWV